MDIGWLFKLGYITRRLPEAFGNVSHTAIDCTATQLATTPKGDNRNTIAVNPERY
jgi:hypothetical protein